MGTKTKWFRRRGKCRRRCGALGVECECGIIYLAERHCGQALFDCLDTTDEKIAEIRRREIHIAVEKGEYQVWKTKFDLAVQESFGVLTAGKAASTRRNYRVSLYKHLIPQFGEMRLAEIGSAELRKYKELREDEGCGQVVLGRELWLVRWLLRRYGRDLAPLREPFRRPHKPIDRFPTVDEIRLITDGIQSVKYRAVALVAAFSGIRKVDLFALRWGDIDLKSRFIHLRQVKTGRWVRVPLNDLIIDALGTLPRGIGDTRVFDGGTIPTLDYHWSRAKKAVGLHWVRFHDLRHFYLSFLANQGVHPLQLKNLAGHTSLKSTERYMHSTDQALLDAVEPFNIAKTLPSPTAGKRKTVK